MDKMQRIKTLKNRLTMLSSSKVTKFTSRGPINRVGRIKDLQSKIQRELLAIYTCKSGN